MVNEVLMDEPDGDAVKLFMSKLGADERVARILAGEGISTIEEIAYVPLQELLAIKALSKEELLALREKAPIVLLKDDIDREP